MNKVYEIGHQFRNESIDDTHNPEFASCESYEAYADMYDSMQMTEDFLCGLVNQLFGSDEIKFTPKGKDEKITINFKGPYPRINMLEELEKRTGMELLNADFTNVEVVKMLDSYCKANDIECGKPRTVARLLDKMVGHYIEPQCINPTFITHHPLIMSPLAKPDRNNPNLTERYELFIIGMEFANAYTELNDPFLQRQRFAEQTDAKNNGDDEACGLDENFCNALEHSLPPCCGLGIGIERLIMLLSGETSIKEVMAFPMYTRTQ
jgi:lysyl-tRNA synthetase class 2